MRSLISLAIACSTAVNAVLATSWVEPRMSASPRDAHESSMPTPKGRWRATLKAVLADPGYHLVAGSASMAPGSRVGTTVAMVYILGGTPMRVHPWSVRRGHCGADAGALTRHALFEPLVVGRDGQSAGSATLELPTPAIGAYYVAVYSASTDMETVIACGDLEPPHP